jgi:hypothetical protein
MTFELPSLPVPVLDRADNPYMPRHLQQVPLNLDPGDFALLHPLPELPPSNIGLIDGAHGPIITTTGPVHNDADADELDDIDDNSSDSLDSIEDHEFPSFFSQRGSPPRLFHSHGTYSLPVDGDEMKVCTSTFGSSWLCGHSTPSKKRYLPLPLRLEAASSTHPSSHDTWKQLRCSHP